MVLLARQLCFASRDVAGDVLRDRHNTWVRTYMAGSDFLASARLSQCLQFCVRCGSSWELHFAVTGAILSHRVVLAVAGAILWTCWVALSWQADACGVGFGDFDLRFAWAGAGFGGVGLCRRRICAEEALEKIAGQKGTSHPNPIASHHITRKHINSHHIASLRNIAPHDNMTALIPAAHHSTHCSVTSHHVA